MIQGSEVLIFVVGVVVSVIALAGVLMNRNK